MLDPSNSSSLTTSFYSKYKFSNSAQLCSTLYDSVQLCTSLYDSVQRDGGSAVAAVWMLRQWQQPDSAASAGRKDVGIGNSNNGEDKDRGNDGNRNEDEVATKMTTRRRRQLQWLHWLRWRQSRHSQRMKQVDHYLILRSLRLWFLLTDSRIYEYTNHTAKFHSLELTSLCIHGQKNWFLSTFRKIYITKWLDAICRLVISYLFNK